VSILGHRGVSARATTPVRIGPVVFVFVAHLHPPLFLACGLIQTKNFVDMLLASTATPFTLGLFLFFRRFVFGRFLGGLNGSPSQINLSLENRGARIPNPSVLDLPNNLGGLAIKGL
jgi:hypothetical protein